MFSWLTRVLSSPGRVYIAQEGINAQVAVAHNLLPHLQEVMAGFAELSGARPNVDVEPVPPSEMPFVGLHVRVRKQVVSDALPESASLDWANCGPQLSPREWHATVESAGAVCAAGGEGKTVVVDCRNGYESDVGKFEGAVPLGTETFKDTWERLEEIVGAEDRGKTKLLIYCTGGIRCVKVGAYLKQKMGFEHVSRLEGGIVNYARGVKEGEVGSHQSLFKGINYVFDSRVGTLVTDSLPDGFPLGGKGPKTAQSPDIIEIGPDRWAKSQKPKA